MYDYFDDFEPDYEEDYYYDDEPNFNDESSSVSNGCDGECWDCNNSGDCANSIFDRD